MRPDRAESGTQQSLSYQASARPLRLSPEGDASSRPRLLYLAGVGRSGSTILDIVLGNHERIESLGELGKFTLREADPDQFCACGEQIRQCPFWRQVKERWVRRLPRGAVHTYVDLQNQFEQPQGGLWGLGRGNADAFERYAALTRQLLATIQDVSRSSVLVDSSGTPSRGAALARIRGLDLFVVHLVRDPREVASSMKKSFDRSPADGIATTVEGLPAWRAGAHWSRVNLQAERVARRVPAGRAIRVRYERFVSDPAATLGQIGDMLGLDLRSLADAAASGASMDVGHTVAGNRVRMQGTVSLRKGGGRGSDLSAGERAAVALSSRWLSLGYGYR